MKDFYSVNELAEQLGVTTRSIRNYLHEGKLKGTKVGGQWKFSERNLFEFLYGDQAEEAAKEMQRFLYLKQLKSARNSRDVGNSSAIFL